MSKPYACFSLAMVAAVRSTFKIWTDLWNRSLATRNTEREPWCGHFFFNQTYLLLCTQKPHISKTSDQADVTDVYRAYISTMSSRLVVFIRNLETSWVILIDIYYIRFNVNNRIMTTVEMWKWRFMAYKLGFLHFSSVIFAEQFTNGSKTWKVNHKPSIHVVHRKLVYVYRLST